MPDCLAVASSLASFEMRVFRVLALVLFGVGLFIQGAAYASAQPAPPAEGSSHCQEMTASEQVPAEDDGNGCCDEMQLGCLVSMNCLAPLFPPAAAVADLAVRSAGRDYSITSTAPTVAFVPGPEPPPPQRRS